MTRFARGIGLLAALAGCLVFAPGAPAGDGGITELVPGTAILADQLSASGNGGNLNVASSNTNIFTPSAFVDFKRFGGEPSLTVDRYPFSPAHPFRPLAVCPPLAVPPCFGQASTDYSPRDITYESAPQGFVFPHFSQFYKSDDLAGSFRKSEQFPIHGDEIANAGGGGDSHQAVGEITHDVYYVDLTLFPGITMNVSEDLGETFRSDTIGEGLNFLDDRQWVDADEAWPGTVASPGPGRVYVSTINLLNAVTPTLATTINTTGWPMPFDITDSPCNPSTYADRGTSTTPLTEPADDAALTPCPDPSDPYLWVAGPVISDKWATSPHYHDVYIPFIRRISKPLGTGLFGIDAWQLYIAKSHDGGDNWTRHLVAVLPNTVNPSNIFPEMAIDRGGNLYYTWSQTQGASTTSTQGQHTQPGSKKERAGEQDIYYTYSQGGGLAGTWASPIDLTQESNDSAVFPWMVAGDAGNVDIVYYKSNTGVNSNFALVDDQGGCEEDPSAPNPCDANARPNPAVWNVYFGQSNNALNNGPNFKSVQVSAQPNHFGVLCTGGLGCSEDRDVLDFFTVDIDHLGAAVIAYSDDHQSRNTDTRDKVTRQISGNSVFKNTPLSSLQQNWPIKDHSVSDRLLDVFDTASVYNNSCPGMDISKLAVGRSNGLITVTLTLNAAPTKANATACGRVASDGGLWGAEFWAPSSTLGGVDQSNTFYIGYRDDLNGMGVEGGTVDYVNATVTSLEFHKRTSGTLSGGTCLPTIGPPATGTCTIAMTVPQSALGIPSGGALNNTTGLSTYTFGVYTLVPPGTRVVLGNSEQADATAALYVSGTGNP